MKGRFSLSYINNNFLKLRSNYIFPEIIRRTKIHKEKNPKLKIINLGIGDVTQPLPLVVIDGMHKAVDEMYDMTTFRGYGPEEGYDFLKSAIANQDYNSRNIKFSLEEIFINDGINIDASSILEMFSRDNKIGILNPTYPVYENASVIYGYNGVQDENGYWSDIHYINCTEENGFVPEIPKEKLDIIYLCFPNNPTGVVISRDELKKWVDYAQQNDSIILYDAAYEAFVSSENVPRSIYEIENSKNVAIEFRSFSKNAGFTGIRCGFTVVPKELKGRTKENQSVCLQSVWQERQQRKTNGISYVTQRAAESVYTKEGQRQVANLVDSYMKNAIFIKNCMESLGFKVFGGVDAPYVWIKLKNRLSSWDFFDNLLFNIGIVGTPGIGFGHAGEGYFRLSAFCNHEDTKEAMTRIIHFLS